MSGYSYETQIMFLKENIKQADNHIEELQVQLAAALARAEKAEKRIAELEALEAGKAAKILRLEEEAESRIAGIERAIREITKYRDSASDNYADGYDNIVRANLTRSIEIVRSGRVGRSRDAKRDSR